MIYDPVGGDIFDLSTKCIAPEGRLLVIGFASGRIPSIAANRVLLKNISLVGVLWGGYVQSHPEYARQAHPALMEMYAAGKIRPSVGAAYAIRGVCQRALRDLADRKVMGKAVLCLASDIAREWNFAKRFVAHAPTCAGRHPGDAFCALEPEGLRISDRSLTPARAPGLVPSP